MKVGDITYKTVKDATTKVTTTIEHIVTQEEVDAYNEQVTESEKQTKLSRLSDLRKKINFEDEYKIVVDKMTSTYTDSETILIEIHEIQDFIGLEELPDELRPCIDYNCVSNKDTTREDLIEMVGILANEVFVLKGGVPNV